MAVSVALSDLDTWLQSQIDNTPTTPYEISITGLTKNNFQDIDDILQNNPTKYVDLSETVSPSDLYTYYIANCVSLVVAPPVPSGTYSFTLSGCTSIVTAPEIPDSVLIIDSAFYGCTSLKNVPRLPRWTSLTGYAYEQKIQDVFAGCTSLVTAPNLPPVYKEAGGTFYGCTSLVNAPSSIGCTYCEGIFSGCTSLVYPPSFITGANIKSAFKGCTSLAYRPLVRNPTTNASTYEDVIDLYGGTEEDVKSYINSESISSYMNFITTDTNKSVKGIPASADVSRLSDYLDTLSPNTVNTPYYITLGWLPDLASSSDAEKAEAIRTALIEHNNIFVDLNFCIFKCNFSSSHVNSYFRNCTTLVGVPYKLTQISSNTVTMNYTFQGCTNLKYVSESLFNQYITSYEYAFAGCTSLVEVTGILSKANTTKSCSNMFYNCTSLERVVFKFPANGYSSSIFRCSECFAGCTSLIDVHALVGTTVKNVVPSIFLGGAFEGCTSLESVIIDSVSELYGCFKDCINLKNVTTDDGSQIVGAYTINYAFQNCTSLEILNCFPANAKDLVGFCKGCSSLKSIPKLTRVENLNEAFEGCSSLENIELIPSTVLRAKNAFKNCTSLTKIDEFGISASTLDSSNFQDMFAGCNALTQIGYKVAPSDEWHVFRLKFGQNTVEGEIFDKYGNSTDINEGTAVSITKSSLTFPVKSDEVWFPPSSLSDADLEDTILDVIENKYTYWKKIALDPTKKSFVMYADDPDNFVTNIPMGGNSFNICYPIGCTYTQYPMQKSPMQLWGTISTWEVINYGGAFFRAEGGNAMTFDANIKAITAVSGSTITIANHGASVGTVILDYAEDSAGHIIRNESRVVTAVSGNVLTLNSQFTSTNLRNVLIGQSPQNYAHSHTRGTMNITGQITNTADRVWFPTGGASNSALYTSDAKANYTGERYEGGKTSQTLNFNASRSWTGATSENGGVDARPTNFTYKIWVRTA